MSDAPINLLLERVNRLTRDMADMREGHNQLFRILTPAVENLRGEVENVRVGVTRSVDGLREEVAGLRREVGSLASEQALLANRVEEAFSRAVRAEIRLDDLHGDGRPGSAV